MTHFTAGLAGDMRPVGVLGLDEDNPFGANFLAEEVEDVLLKVLRPDIGVRLVGILEGVPSSTQLNVIILFFTINVK